MKDTSPLYHANGSVGYCGGGEKYSCRYEDSEQIKFHPIEHYLVQVKSNLAPTGSAILFEVADEGVNLLDEVELAAEDAFKEIVPRMGRANEREEAAAEFIRELLSDGSRPAVECEAKLEAADFKKSTYKKAKKKIGVHSVKDGFSWYWSLREVDEANDKRQAATDDDGQPF